MRSANYIKPGKIEFRDDTTRPGPAAGEVLIKVAVCGICGSDLHMYRNDSYRDLLVRTTPEGYDIPGHEYAGTIAEIGEGVEGWKVGERVVGGTEKGGGMADFAAVPDNPFQLARIPDGVSDMEAATTEPLADGLQMVRKAEVKEGENLVVFGVGIIGLGVIQSIHARGVKAGNIIAVDVHEARLDKALEIGATHKVNARDGSVFDAVAEICGTTTDYAGTSANIGVVFDCAGYIKHMKGPPPLETALRVIDLIGGRIICFGGYEGAMTIDMGPMIEKQPTIMGSNGYASEELVEALEIMRDKRADRKTLMSHQFPLEDISEAFEAQCQSDAVKVMIEIS